MAQQQTKQPARQAAPLPSTWRNDAAQHLADLAKHHWSPVPAEARTLSSPRIRQIARWAARDIERLRVAGDAIALSWSTPSRRLGAIRYRLRMLRIGVLGPGLLVSIVVFAAVALWRFGVLKPVEGKAGDTIVAALFGSALLAVLVSVWSDLVRSPFTAWRIGRAIRKRPETVLPTTARQRRAELTARDEPHVAVPREELYDEVMPGLLDHERRDLQMLVGDAGAGKTTALVELSRLLAKVGVIPIVVEMWGGQAVDVEKEARRRLEQHAAASIGPQAHMDALWHWLRQRRRLVVLIDDIDRVAPDGERGYVLRRTLDDVAARDLPTVVTARPAGLPAGLAATAINLDRLKEKDAVKHVLDAARRELGAKGGHNRAAIEGSVQQWVKQGAFADVPFYLELLTRLVAVGRCPALPPAVTLKDERTEPGRAGRVRQRPDGEWEWNPVVVRFKLLEHFYAGIEEGHVHRWLGIDVLERKSMLGALGEAALSLLAATAIEARERPLRLRPEERVAKRTRLEQFLNPNDRREVKYGRRGDVSAHEVVDAGERMRLLDRDPRGELHFRHRIMQAYLAGRCLHQQHLTPRTTKDWFSREGLRPHNGHATPATRLDWLGALLDRHHPERLTAHMTLMFAALHADKGGGGNMPKIIVDRLVASVRDAQSHHGNPQVGAQRLDPREAFDPDLETSRRDPDDELAKLTTAAEIIRALNLEHTINDAAQAERKDWVKIYDVVVRRARDTPGATRWTKHQAIPSIAGLQSDRRWDCLWGFATDEDYEVRRMASEALQDNAREAFQRLAPTIDALTTAAAFRSLHGRQLDLPMNVAAARRPPAEEYAAPSDPFRQWSMDDVLRLRALGWVLPAIVSGLREDPRLTASAAATTAQDEELRNIADQYGRAGLALEQLAVLSFQQEHHALEASLAQGFKTDAMRHVRDPERLCGPGLVTDNRRLVTDLCLDQAGSWYARLTLHQALALYTIAGSSTRVAFDTFGRCLHRQGEPHPFVCRTARLARRAVGRHVLGRASWDKLLWADEAAVVGRRPTTLSRGAVQLAGDVTLLLNLADRVPAERHAKIASTRALPHCLSASTDRLEILGAGCPTTCHHDLCPLTAPPVDEPSAQRTVSRAFCRAEQQVARHRRPPWQKRISHRALKQFWWEMERRART